MEKILRYLAEETSFLYRKYKCRIVDSLFTNAFGGDSLMVLESPGVRLRIYTARGEPWWDFQALHRYGESDWYDLGLVRKLLLDESDSDGGLLDSEVIRFLREDLALVEQAFSKENFPETREKLKALQRARVKKMFGWTSPEVPYPPRPFQRSESFDLYFLERVEVPVPGLDMKCPCEGYAGLSLSREELSPTLLDLRSRGIRAYVIPLIYRDETPSVEDLSPCAWEIFGRRWGARLKSVSECGSTPACRTFRALLKDGKRDYVTLDRMDGQVWDEEYEEGFLWGWTENPDLELAARDVDRACTFEEKLTALERVVKTAHPSGKSILENELRRAKNDDERKAIQALINR